jgi:trigger factor
MKTEQKKLPKSQLEITFELTAEEFKEHTAHAVEHLKQHIKVDGFRAGKAPAKMVEDKIKPEMLLMEAGDHAVQHVYVDYIKESKLEPVGQPEVSIVKIAQGSPFIFKAVITVLPDVELPNYKEIAKTVKGKEVSVTEQEIQDSINYLQKTRAKFILKNEPAEKKDFVEIQYYCPLLDTKKVDPVKSADEVGGVSPKAKQFDWVNDKFILGEGGFMKGFEDNIVGMKAGEEKEFSVKFPDNSPRKDLAGKEGVFKVKMVSVQKMELPEMNDEFAKQLGAFDSLMAFKTSMREGIKMEKMEEEKQRLRAEILEKIAEKAKFEMPEAMVEYEKERLLGDFKNRIVGSAKISFEEYLASVKQTEEQVKQTFHKEAEKRLKGFLVLRELGKKESVDVTDQEVAEEVTKSIKNYSKEQLAKIDINELKEYTKGVIHNEKIFQILEKMSR